MKSLKTDDILGARPTIRHAPRNLIRDQRLSHQQASSYPYASNGGYPANPEPGYQAQYPYNNQISRNYAKHDPNFVNEINLS